MAGLTTAALTALSVVGLYQFGLLRRVPEPAWPGLGADEVDAAGEAYQLFKTPDAALGPVTAAATLVLAGMDAVAGGYLLLEQLTKHQRVCSWCTLASLAQIATVPVAVPEAPGCLARSAQVATQFGFFAHGPRQHHQRTARCHCWTGS